MAEANLARAKSRPISPHIQIYRWPLPMMMSIAHRATGIGLYFGTILVVWWLIAAASGPNAYASIGSFMNSWIGRAILFVYTWTILHHMLGGVRYLIWDTTHGMDLHEREALSLANIVASVGLTVLIWVIGYFVLGGSR